MRLRASRYLTKVMQLPYQRDSVDGLQGCIYRSQTMTAKLHGLRAASSGPAVGRCAGPGGVRRLVPPNGALASTDAQIPSARSRRADRAAYQRHEEVRIETPAAMDQMPASADEPTMLQGRISRRVPAKAGGERSPPGNPLRNRNACCARTSCASATRSGRIPVPEYRHGMRIRGKDH